MATLTPSPRHALPQTIFVYQLVDPSLLLETQGAYAEHLQAPGPGRPLEPSFRMSPFGCIRYFDEGRMGSAARPDLLLADENAVKTAATKYMADVNAATARWRAANGIDSSRHPDLFPSSLVHLRSWRVQRRGSRTPDHWTSLWGLSLPVTTDVETPRSPVIGATVQLRLGARGFVLGVVSTIRPCIGMRTRPLIPWRPITTGGEPAILVYLAERAEQPQPFLAPYWADVASGGEQSGHDQRTFWPATDHSVLAEIEVTQSRGAVALRARLPQSPGKVAYADDQRTWRARWLIADLDAIIDGKQSVLETLSPTLEAAGLYHVELELTHLATGVIQTSYASVPVATLSSRSPAVG